MESNMRDNVESKFPPVGSPPTYGQPRQKSSIFVVNSCCCGCTLKTGCKIIGWLQVALGILIVVTYTYLMQSFENQPREDIVKVIAGIAIAVGVINAALGALLLFGVAAKRSAVIFTWIVIFSIMLVIAVLSTIGKFFTASGSPILTDILQVCLGVYYLIVVNSYRKSLKYQHPIV